jgi:hypothetical protein
MTKQPKRRSLTPSCGDFKRINQQRGSQAAAAAVLKVHRQIKQKTAKLEQIPTIPVSDLEIMTSRWFALGVADGRANRPFPADYDAWSAQDRLWSYERGRLWGRAVPRSVQLKSGGRVTAQAIAWFKRLGPLIP